MIYCIIYHAAYEKLTLYLYTVTCTDIGLLLNDEELRTREDELAVQNLFAVGMTDPDLFDLNVTHDVHDIPLGLGWRWDSPVVLNENTCDVVGKADNT